MSWAHITPEAQERNRQRLREQWADPEYRARHVERLRTQSREAALGGKKHLDALKGALADLGVSDPLDFLEVLAEQGWRITRSRDPKRAETIRKLLWQAKRDAEGPPP